MRKIAMMMAMVIMAGLAVSCQKDKEAELPTFTAHADNGGMKTELVGNYVCWTNTDRVKVFGDFGYAIYGVTPRGDDPTWATLTPVENHGITGFLPYRFVYPADMASGGTANNNTLYVTYPQDLNSGDAPLRHFPMYGESDHRDVVFQNLGGLMRIKLRQEGVRLSKVIVSANENIAGRFRVDLNNESQPLTGGMYKYVNIFCSNALIDDGWSFWLSLPAGQYTGMKIEIINSDGDTCVKESSGTVEIGRSLITTIEIGELDFSMHRSNKYSYVYDGHITFWDINMVNLGLPSGRLWQTEYLHTNLMDVYGAHFNSCHYRDILNGNLTFPDSYRLPTESDFLELMNNCDVEYDYNGGVYLTFVSRSNGNRLRIICNNYFTAGTGEDCDRYWSILLKNENGEIKEAYASIIRGEADPETLCWTYEFEDFVIRGSDGRGYLYLVK